MKWTSPFFLILIFSYLLVSCATSDKDFDRAKLEKNDEFDQVIKIETLEPAVKEEETKKEVSKKQVKKKSPQKKKDKSKKAEPVKKAAKKNDNEKKSKDKKVKNEIAKKKKLRQPRLEDDEGFDGRRPIVEPYEVGEEIIMGISYFAVEAGKFTMKVMPMVQVNGKKSYHFRYLIKSSPLFSMFYKVDDIAETFVDYETLVPYSYEIHADESKQQRETRTFFDHKKNKAIMWDKKKKPGKELEKRKKEWDILPFSHNVFSVAYYLRNFTLKVGKELKVRVGHEGKNIVMTAKVLRRETIYTDAGKFDCHVVKPKFNVEGKFKPTGENYLWLTADDNKYIVRLESKIKIGSIVGEVQKIKKR